MELWQIGILALVGIIAGFLNVVAGGGSLLTMPIMVFMGMSGPAANGSNRVGIIFQNLAAIRGFRKQGFADFKRSITLSLCAIPGAVAGAYMGTKLDGPWFNRVLALVMIGVMLLMAFKKKANKGEVTETAPPGQGRVVAAHLLMVLAGVYGGFIQAGVGFILMAILYRVMGEDLVRVNMHKVFIVGSYTIVAVGIFAWKGQVDWFVGLGLAAGNAIGGSLGSKFSVKKGEGAIKVILNIALVALAAKLIYESLPLADPAAASVPANVEAAVDR